MYVAVSTCCTTLGETISVFTFSIFFFSSTFGVSKTSVSSIFFSSTFTSSTFTASIIWVSTFLSIEVSGSIISSFFNVFSTLGFALGF